MIVLYIIGALILGFESGVIRKPYQNSNVTKSEDQGIKKNHHVTEKKVRVDNFDIEDE